MHPRCFEIFKKASLSRFGKVDIDGLFLLKDVSLTRFLHYISDSRTTLMLRSQVMPGNDEFSETVRFRKFPDSPDLSLVLDQW